MRRPPVSLALLTALAAGPALAGSLTVAVDHSVRLPLAGPAGSVVVGNPAVADVTVVDSRSVFVSGRGPGSTDITVVDPLGRTVFSGEVRVASEAGAHVIVHRGPSGRTDLSCDPGCVPSAANGSAAKPAADAGAGAPAVVLNAVGGAVAGGAAAVAAGLPSARPS